MLIVRARLNEEILLQHAEEAAFGWSLRERALHSPYWTSRELARIEAGMRAHIEALLIAGARAWPIASQAWSDGWPGECFAALVFAAHLRQPEPTLKAALDLFDPEDGEREAGVASSLAWLPESRARELEARWLVSEVVGLRRAALAGLAMAGRAPMRSLDIHLSSPDARERMLACDLLGASAQHGWDTTCAILLDDGDPRVRLAAALALWRRGGTDIAERMLALVTSEHATELDPRRVDLACGLAFATVSGSAATTWMTRLTATPDLARLALVGAAGIGDPALVPWLIAQTANPRLGRAAASAILAITGAQLELDKLDAAATPVAALTDSDAPDEDPEAHVPWPDRQALERWWAARDPPQAGVRLRWGARQERAPMRALLCNLDVPPRLRTLVCWQLCLHQGGIRFPSMAPLFHQFAYFGPS